MLLLQHTGVVELQHVLQRRLESGQHVFPGGRDLLRRETQLLAGTGLDKRIEQLEVVGLADCQGRQPGLLPHHRLEDVDLWLGRLGNVVRAREDEEQAYGCNEPH